MHILVTNDDGPPSSQSSPYVRCLIKHLEEAGHKVSVCLPHTQRSWIGKAHMIGKTLKPLYYTPSATIHGDDTEGTTHTRPSTSGDADEWVLIDGTPASCVQIGLYHFFQDKGPIDLVVSGPNYGRNTTAAFALSSGTLGAALEAAVCKRKAIALSFAFFSRNHDPVIIEAACRRSIKVIEALYKQWPTDGSADLYSVNVPLVENVEDNKTLWTNMLQNYWRNGSCFQEIEDDNADAANQEEQIREGPGGETGETKVAANGVTKGHSHKHFKWAPRFTDVYKSVEEAGPGNDGWAVQQGHTSITPLKANFFQTPEAFAHGELKLSPTPSVAVQGNGQVTRSAAIQAIVSYEDPYVQPLIVSALQSIFSEDALSIVTKVPASEQGSSLASMLSSPENRVLQITAYEAIDFEFAASHPGSCLINSYMIRKALIRKHYLSVTVDHWVAKNPTSMVKQHVRRSETFEIDYAEFLDDAIIECFDLRESMEKNDALSELPGSSESEKEWWILKPGMSDRGQGIRLFSTMQELQDIFDGWEAERPDSDDEYEDEDGQPGGEGESKESGGDYITTSHLRHFVAQPYIHPPLLVQDDARKFHIRTYVLCTGSLNVYVYKHMLALFAAKPYTPPWESTDDIETFLTNTCLQDSPGENTVRRFWSLPLPDKTLAGIFEQICEMTGDIFEAAARAMPIHFQTMPNAFEVFGLDFLVDAQGVAWLLEVNSFPDFKQTGGDLRDIIEGFWTGVLRRAVPAFFGLDEGSVKEVGKYPDGDMVVVKQVDLGRR